MDGFLEQLRFGLRAMRGARIVAIRSFFKARRSRSDESVAKVSSQMRVLGRVLSAVQRSESGCCTRRRSLREAVKFEKHHRMRRETCLLVDCPLPDLTQSTLQYSLTDYILERSLVNMRCTEALIPRNQQISTY